MLLFSGLNFAGYIARHAVGSRRGYGITGALGGLVSSTAVTLNFSRQSVVDGELGIALARGVVAACTVLVPRVLDHQWSAQSSRDGRAGTGAPAAVPRRSRGRCVRLEARHVAVAAGDETKSPLRLASALQMALAFQVAMTAIKFARMVFGSAGLLGAAALLGLTDVDALTVSMSSPASQLTVPVAARALAVGIISNTVLKFLVVLIVGRGTFRRAASAGLLGLAAATAIGLFLIW